MTSTIGVALAALAVGAPALLFVLWPFLRRRAGGVAGLLPLPPDARERLAEDRRAALRALRELEFEHDAGHISDADYDELRARYEAETAAILVELDRLGVPRRTAPPAAAPAPAAAAGPRPAWRHPAALAVAGLALVVFGVALGVGIMRYAEPDANAGAMGGRGMTAASTEGMPGGMGGAPPVMGKPNMPLTPEVMQGMLAAARQSLFDGNYSQAMMAYQAVLKRDPDNVDALTHMGLIASIAARGTDHGPEMITRALALFDRALARDPNYAPALLYRGQVLFEVKKDPAGAIQSWEKFLAVTPPGEDHDRVAQMLAEARAQAGGARR
jgi:tetratricopeptide (TPR) repeat protein